MDALLLDFMKENMITMGFIIGVLKLIATETETTLDNKILSMFTNIFTSTKK